jgi:hypothetical protein
MQDKNIEMLKDGKDNGVSRDDNSSAKIIISGAVIGGFVLASVFSLSFAFLGTTNALAVTIPIAAVYTGILSVAAIMHGKSVKVSPVNEIPAPTISSAAATLAVPVPNITISTVVVNSFNTPQKLGDASGMKHDNV